ncbi:MAG: ribonuclease HII [Patescibacteria group bacterium]
MKYPNFNEEKKLWKKGYKFVAGLDEAGRGPLAGPVVAAAVSVRRDPTSQKLHASFKEVGSLLLKVKDSKKLNAKQREEIYEALIKHPQVSWGVGIVSEKVIDKINILGATKLAMRRAIISLVFSIGDRQYRCLPDFLLIDGNFKINSACLPTGRQKSVIKGDQKVFSIAAASIIAKVTRDKIMQKYHKKYPQYGFAKHKGYGTKAHFASLKKFGPCKIHRKTFYPVSEFINLS